MLARLDIRNMRIKLGDSTFVELTESTVEMTLGVHSGGEEMDISSELVSSETLTQLRRWLCVDDGIPTLEDAKAAVTREWPKVVGEEEENCFTVIMATLCCGYMFGPWERVSTIPVEIMEAISNSANVRSCNWGSYVLHVIKVAAQKVQCELQKARYPSSVLLGGCWLYLQVRMQLSV